jgi:hypothetical protein
MIDLERRLSTLADELDLDDDVDARGLLVDQVLARLDEPDRSGWSRRSLQVAALVVLVVAASVVAVPSSRRTLADWFGFDRARIELRPDLSVPEQAPVISPTPTDAEPSGAAPPTPSETLPSETLPSETSPSETLPSETLPSETLPSGSLPGPGRSSTVLVDGIAVLVSALDGTLDDGLITKMVGGDSSVREVDVAGRRGVWIDGAPHDLAFLTGDGEVVFERFAGNTLPWQDGDVLYRVEGFPTLADAAAYASKLSR